MHSKPTKSSTTKTLLALSTALLITSIFGSDVDAASKKEKPKPQTSFEAKDASLVIKFPTSWKGKTFKVSDASGVLHTGKLNKYGNARVDLKKNVTYRTTPSDNVTVDANKKTYTMKTNLVKESGGSLISFKEYYAQREHFTFDLSLNQTFADYQEVTIKQPVLKRKVVEQYTTMQNLQEVTVEKIDGEIKTGKKHPVTAYAEAGYYNNKAHLMGPTERETVAFLENGKPYRNIILR